MLRSLNFALAVLMVCGLSGCSSNVAWVYVDNGSDKSMTVELNGAAVAEVAPGEVQKVVMPLGEQKIEVKSEGEIVYSQTKNLEPSEKALTTRRYLLNPEGSKKYWVYQVKYGENLFEGVMDSIDQRDELTKAHRSLCKGYDLLVDSEWFAVPNRCYVLQDAPESAAVRQGSSMKIPVLYRVSSENFQTLQHAKGIERPTKEDLERLESAYSDSMAMAN